MEKTLTEIKDALPYTIKNSGFIFHLEGWPATAAITICVVGATVCFLYGKRS